MTTEENKQKFHFVLLHTRDFSSALGRITAGHGKLDNGKV